MRRLPSRFHLLTSSFLLLLFLPASGYAQVSPVGHLPTVTAGATPSPYVLPILMVSDQNEWKDFGIQVNLKVYPNEEELMDRVVGNEWDVGVTDPFYAVKAGNDGDVAIVGLGGNFLSLFHLVGRKGASFPTAEKISPWLQEKEVLISSSSAEEFFLSSLMGLRGGGLFRPRSSAKKEDPGEAFLKGKGELTLLRSPFALKVMEQGFPSWPELPKAEVFLPACLVAGSSYADTRKTLVIRWLEGYSRGVRLIQKNPSKAASRLKAFYLEASRIDVPQRLLEMEIAKAFFDEKKQEEAFQNKGGNPSAVERFAHAMSDYQMRMKALKSKREPGEYIQGKICDQLAALRGEAETQFKKTQTAIDLAEKEGTKVEKLRRDLGEARGQMEEGRGCLTVIGTLSNLMRSADQNRMETQRFKKFRLLELGLAGLLIAYYAGYAVRRKKFYCRERREINGPRERP